MPDLSLGSQQSWRTDFQKRTVDMSEVVSGGPPKDGIPDGEDAWVLMLRFDATSGALSWDRTFRDPDTGALGLDFDRLAWPHGETGKAMPHGAVFRR